jgi:hypothetical protein
MFYSRDTETEKQQSLKTKSRTEGERLVVALNQTADTPQLNRALAKVFAALQPEASKSGIQKPAVQGSSGDESERN